MSLTITATQRRFGSNALIALACGFGAAAAIFLPDRRLRGVNTALAAVCAAAAALLDATISSDESAAPIDPQLQTEPSHPAIDYSIIVPVYNRPQYVRAILARIAMLSRSWDDLGTGEIVIVDDGSMDETLATASSVAADMPLKTTVISIPHSGPGAARNAGFAAARGTIGVAIDSDCLPEDDWLSGLLREVRTAKQTAAFAAIRSSAQYCYPIENMPDAQGYVSASFAIDRTAFCELGGFYQRYGMSHEDFDFVEKLKSAGFRIVRAQSHIEHPLRRETPTSIWRVGLNSRYANLFVSRHGVRAAHITRTTPYYFLGIRGNYGSSIAMLVYATNVAVAVLLRLVDPMTPRLHRSRVLGSAPLLYLTALLLIGLKVGAGVRRLPVYVLTLASFQIATLLGRLRGSYQYRLPLL